MRLRSNFTTHNYFTMLQNIASLLCLAAVVLAHDDPHDQTPIQGPHQGLWYTTFDNIPGDGGTQASQLRMKTN